jgi:uncharacterized tellurite resistance protein B-like protein
MRPYEIDSPPAVARLLALTMLADGGLDEHEIDAVQHSQLARSLTVDEATFSQVVQEFCEDLMLTATYLDAMHVRLDHQVLDELLEEVSDPMLRRALLVTMAQIAEADGVFAPAEQALLARAEAKWGMKILHPVAS